MIRAEISRESQQEFRRVLAEFQKKSGKSVEESVVELGKASARQLAMKVPPFGVSSKVGDRFSGSIAKQVNRAVSAGNVAGRSGTAEQLHESYRNAKGQVPRGLEDRGRYRREPIPVREKEDLIDKRQKAAGIVKGAWLHCLLLIGGKASGFGQWIRRHTHSGKATIRPRGISTEVTLTNEIKWVSNVQNQKLVKMALNTALRNTIKRMEKIIART